MPYFYVDITRIYIGVCIIAWTSFLKNGRKFLALSEKGIRNSSREGLEAEVLSVDHKSVDLEKGLINFNVKYIPMKFLGH